MFNTKFQVFLNKFASVLFVLWIYVASPLMTISLIGGYGAKAKDNDRNDQHNQPKENICHNKGSASNPDWEYKEIEVNSHDGHFGHGDFYYTGPNNNKDSWCRSHVPTVTPTPSPTPTNTVTPTVTITPTVTVTPTTTVTEVPTELITPTVTETPTSTPTDIQGTIIVQTTTVTEIPTESPTPSVTPTLELPPTTTPTTEVTPVSDETAPSISFTGFKDQINASYDSSKPTKACGSYNTSGFISWEWVLNNEEIEPVTYTYKIFSGPTAVGFTANTSSTHFNGQIPAQGTYVVEVFGTDAAHNIGNAVQCSVTFDNSAPEVPTGIHFDNPGLSCGALTTAGMVTIDWNDVSDASRYDYFVNYPKTDGTRGEWQTSVVPSQYTGSLNQGTHYAKVRAVDAAGNVSAWSPECSITRDSIAPAVPSGLKFQNTARTMDIACGSVVSQQPVTPDWNDVTDDSTFSHFEYTSFWPDGHIGINEQIFTSSEFPNSWPPPTDGAFGYAVRSVDTAGNKSAWALSDKTLEGSCQVIYDSIGPVLTLPANITEEAVTRLGNNVTFDVSALDAVTGSETVTCAPNSGSLFAIATTTVNCSATDDAGNTSTGSFTVTVQDTISPDVLITSPSSSVVSGLVEIRGSVTDVNPHHYWLVIENSSGTQIAGPGVVNDSTSFTDKFFFNWNTILVPDGQYKIKLEARDAANNKDAGSVDWNIVTVDNTAPFLTLPTPIIEEAESAAGNYIDFEATALDGVSGSLPVTCVPTSGSLFAIGTVTVSCSAVDGQGNSETGTFSVTVQDTTAPIVSPPANKTVEATGPTGAVATYSNGTALDAIDGDRPVTCLPTSGSTFSLGLNTVTCSATDTHGNTGTATFTITVRDTTKPSFPFIPTMFKEATGPTGAVVTFAFTATDLVDGVINAVCVPTTGTLFSLGRTRVICRATDNAGNYSVREFSLWVVDTTKPVFGPTPDITTEATGPTGAHVPFSITATDLVDQDVTVWCVPQSNHTFSIGTRTVWCFALDNFLNLKSTSFTVTVVDTTKPVVTPPADMTLYAPNDEGTTATYSASAMDIVDGVLSTTCVPVSGSTFELGTTSVECSATDLHGNTGTASFNVTVIDNIAPTVDLLLPVVSTSIQAVFSENVNEADAENPANYFLNNWPTAGGTGDLIGDATINYDATSHTATISFTDGSWYVSPEQQWGVQNIHDVGGNLLQVTPYTEYSTPMIAPVTTDSGTDANWHNDNVTVNFTCNDGTLLVDASGCLKTYYSVDGGAYVEGNSVVISAEGTHSIMYYSEDLAGNVEIAHSTEFTVKIDKTSPFMTVPANQSFDEQNTGLYYYAFVPTAHEFEFEPTTAVINENDLTVTCTPNQTGFNYPVGTTTVDCSATDRAGNIGTRSFTVTVNNLVPTVTVTAEEADNGSYIFTAVPVGGNTPEYSFQWSGNCTGTSITSQTGISPGTYTCTVTVTDADGDTATNSLARTIFAPAARPATLRTAAAVQGVKTEATPTPSVTPIEEEVLGERTCTTTVKFIGYTYVDKNKNNAYDLGEQLLSGLTGKVAYTLDGVEFVAKTFISDQNGKFEVDVCPGDYNVSINKASLPTGITDSTDVHKVSIMGDKTETTAYLALLATTGLHWSWWWVIIGAGILGVIYFIYRRRQQALESSPN